jgi:hypothetical protein
MNILILVMLACGKSDFVFSYINRNYPECQYVKTLGHIHTDDGSITDVSLTCGEETIVVTVKCVFGGVFSDTICHGNS